MMPLGCGCGAWVMPSLLLLCARHALPPVPHRRAHSSELRCNVRLIRPRARLTTGLQRRLAQARGLPGWDWEVMKLKFAWLEVG